MNRRRLKNEKGSITLYVLISMVFFIVVVFGIYFNTNSKMQKQNKEIEQIQKQYEKEDINDVYEKAMKSNEKLLSEVVEVGDYVSYTPDPTSTTGILGELSIYSGNTDSTKNTANTLKQETGLKWRVLDVVGGKVRLISELPTTSTVALEGYNGYNNAVYLLDKTCKTLYSKAGYSENVQNLKIEDIQNKMSTDYSTIDSNYGTTNITPENKYYPSILMQEKDQTVITSDGTTQPTTRLGLSEQTTPINQTVTKEATSLTVKYTRWDKSMAESDFTDSIYYNLFINNGNNYQTYWVSSRCVGAYSYDASFGVRKVDTGNVNARGVCRSDIHSSGSEYALRPVITLNSDVCVDTSDVNKDGSEVMKAWVLK